MRIQREILQGQSTEGPAPGHKIPPVGECFAWKDNTLDRDLRAIKDKKFSEAPEPKHRDGKTDGLDRSLQHWANTPLPKVSPTILLALSQYPRYFFLVGRSGCDSSEKSETREKSQTIP